MMRRVRQARGWVRGLVPRDRLLLGVVAAVVLVNAVLLAGYLGAEERRDRAQREVAAVEKSVNAMRRPEDIESLRRELADIESRLAGSVSSFPKEIDSLAVYGLLTNAARQSGVDISGVQNGPVGTERFGGNDYQSSRYSVSVRGQLGQVIGFLNKIETSGFATLIVNNQTYTNSGATWTVTIDLVAYAQKNS